jgi:hypothetical protein
LSRATGAASSARCIAARACARNRAHKKVALRGRRSASTGLLIGIQSFPFVFSAILFRFCLPPSNFLAFFAETKKSLITFETAGYGEMSQNRSSCRSESRVRQPYFRSHASFRQNAVETPGAKRPGTKWLKLGLGLLGGIGVLTGLYFAPVYTVLLLFGTAYVAAGIRYLRITSRFNDDLPEAFAEALQRREWADRLIADMDARGQAKNDLKLAPRKTDRSDKLRCK